MFAVLPYGTPKHAVFTVDFSNSHTKLFAMGFSAEPESVAYPNPARRSRV
jgi:hypothetical protein